MYSVYHQQDISLDQEVKDFIPRWHYSKSYRSLKQKHVFKLVDNETDKLVGVAIYGSPMSRHYNDSNYIELRKLCLIDDTPRNTESFFIAKTLKYLSNNTDYNGVITFADPNHGHSGTIYKASNFRFDGEEKSSNPRIIKYGDKEIHLREMYQKKDGEYTESALRIQELVSNKEAEVINIERKLRFIYDFR